MNPPEQKSLLLRLQMRLAASRFFTFSLLLHVVLVVACSSIVLMRRITQAPPDFVAGEDLVEKDSLVPQPSTFSTVCIGEPAEPAVAPIAPVPDLAPIVSRHEQPTHFTIAAGTLAIRDPLADRLPDLAPTASPRGIIRDTRALPDAMKERRPGANGMVPPMRGGKEKSERAVLAGLRWLAEHQNADGSWSDEFRPSMTGLALLCFLGHNELPESPVFGPTVKKGIDWLLANGVRNQGRLSMAPAWTQTGVYEHGIATYALAEYFTMTRDDRVRDLLVEAVRGIVDGQAPDGGWQYAFAKGPDSDTSVSGWQIQALKAAHLTGLEIAGVDDALEKSLLNLRRVRGPAGGFGYRKAEDRYSLTGIGVLCTYFWKGEKDAVVRDGIRFIMDKTDKDFPVQYAGDTADLYAWYYHTQACLMFGGTAWLKWNRWFQDEIADHQSADGSWPPTGNRKPHGPETKPDGAGPVYRTALCTLMLEVFYRYTPTTK